jgi:hypothetical protein
MKFLPGYLSLAAVLVLGFVVGVFAPAVLTPFLFQQLLLQPASDEFAQQMAKPMADMKAMVPMAPATSCVEEQAAKPQVPAVLSLE